jgi:hypothetical protein
MTNSGPTFFIAGAPRCGTTALAEYLRGHPRAFLTVPKEPSYFAEDLPELRFAKSRDQYARLFRDVAPDHLAIGDASVWYLFSEVALARIRNEFPAARIVVSLRNPVDFLRSLHARFVYSRREDRSDFAEAWALQEPRLAGTALPAGNRTPRLLQYREHARFGQQVARLFECFPREQVRVLLLEEWRNEPRATYAGLLDFLGLPDDGRTNFPKVNAQSNHRMPALGTAIMRPPALARRAWRVAKRLGGPGIVRHAERLIAWNSAAAPITPLPAELRGEILADLAGDIAALERLLERDLSAWTDPKPPTTD